MKNKKQKYVYGLFKIGTDTPLFVTNAKTLKKFIAKSLKVFKSDASYFQDIYAEVWENKYPKRKDFSYTKLKIKYKDHSLCEVIELGSFYINKIPKA